MRYALLALAASFLTVTEPGGSMVAQRDGRTAASLNVVVLVDVSASLHRCPEGVAGIPSTTRAASGRTITSMLDRGFIAPAVDEFPLRGLRSDDRVRVGAVGRRVNLGEVVAGNSPELKKHWSSVFALPPVEWLGPSRIWDGLADVVELLAGEPGRRAVVLVTDGLASGNLRSYVDVGASAAFLGVSISVIAEESILATSPPKPMSDVIGRDPTTALRALAEMTGGAFLFDKAVVTPGVPCFVRDPAKYLKEALDRLHEPGRR